MARQGKLVLPAPEDAVEIAGVFVEPPISKPPIRRASRPEIIVGSGSWWRQSPSISSTAMMG